MLLLRFCDSADNFTLINTKTVKFHHELFEILSFEKKQSFMIFLSCAKHCKVLDLMILKDHAIKLGLYMC